jgi:hypothetical protein
MTVRWLQEGEMPERDPAVRQQLLDVCRRSANANVVIQALLETMMIAVVASTASADEALSCFRALSQSMEANAAKCWDEYHAMAEAQQQPRQ